MRKSILRAIAIYFQILLAGCATIPTLDEIKRSEIPIDPELTTGELSNGLRYYVYGDPKKDWDTVEFRLVLEVGSIDERNDQLGYAHFVEHMAFRGTEKYPEDGIATLTALKGSTFGPHVNAFTTYDHTYYILSLPVEDGENLDLGLDILHQWANAVTVDEKSLQSEKSIIVQEMRLRGQEENKVDRQITNMLISGSPYPARLPIGTETSVQTATANSLRNFYKAWYRPDNMSVILVGNLDHDKAVDRITQTFGALDTSDSDPGHNDVTLDIARGEAETFAVLAGTDRLENFVNRLFVRKTPKVDNYGHLRAWGVRQLALATYVYRLNKYAQENLVGLGFHYDRPHYHTGLSVDRISFKYNNEDDYTGAINAYELVAKEIAANGFDEDDMKEARGMQNRFVVGSYKGRLNETATSIANRLLNHVMYETGFQPLAFYKSVGRVTRDITADELKRELSGILKNPYSIYTVESPHRLRGTLPSKQDVRSLLAATRAGLTEQSGSAQADEKATDIASKLALPKSKRGKIKHTATLSGLGVDEWKLENGLHAYYRFNQHQPGDALVYLLSPNGWIEKPYDDVLDYRLMKTFLDRYALTAIYGQNFRQLTNGTSGYIRPLVNDFVHGFTMKIPARRLADVLELTRYVLQQPPEIDEQWFASMRTNLAQPIRDYNKSEAGEYYYQVREALYSGHESKRRLTAMDFENYTVQRLKTAYEKLFQQDNQYVILISGDVHKPVSRRSLAKYLATVPVTDPGSVELPVLRVHTDSHIVVNGNVENRSDLNIYISTEFLNYDTDYELAETLLREILNDRLGKYLREDLGLTYGVSASINNQHFPGSPKLWTISVSCDPTQKEIVFGSVLKTLDELNTTKITDAEIVSARKRVVNRRKTALNTLEGWARAFLTETFKNPISYARLEDVAASFDAIDGDKIQDVAAHQFEDFTVLRADFDPKPGAEF